MALLVRRGPDADRLIVTPLQGELIYTTDTKKLFVGDGATVGGVLVGPTDADAFTEVVGDTSPQLGGNLDLNNNNIVGVGNINIDGTITATGTINLGDEDADVVNVAGVINSSLRPALDGQFNLGSTNRRWNAIFAEGGEISGQFTADSISTSQIVSTDSTIIYDSLTDTLSATIISATGSIQGNLVGDVTGDVQGDIASTGTSTFTQLEADSATISGGTLDGVVIGSDTNIPAADITGRDITANGAFYGNTNGTHFGRVVGDVYGSIQGTVFGGDSSIIIDDTSSTIVGRINNEEITTSVFSGSTIILQGTNRDNEKAGVRIITDGSADDAYALFNIEGFNDSDVGQQLVLQRSRGTQGSPAALQADDEVVTLSWFGADANGAPAGVAAMSAQVDDTPLAGGIPGRLIFGVGDGTGNVVPGIVVNSAQQTNFFGAATLFTYADPTARDTAITSPSPGMMIYLASTNKAQCYDGTTWQDLF
jgi:hypothetical protein